MNKEEAEVYKKMLEQELDKHPLLDVQVPLVGWIEGIASIVLLILAATSKVEWQYFWIILATAILTWAEPYIAYFINRQKNKTKRAIIRK